MTRRHPSVTARRGQARTAALTALMAPGLLALGLLAPAVGAAEPAVTLENGSTPDTRPFPADAFTVTDPAQATGRRVDLPTAGCDLQGRSLCDQLALINTLDGFDVRPRVTLPFTGAIDLSSVTADAVRIEGPNGFRTRLVQLVQDPSTGTVAGYPEAYLAPATSFTLTVGAGLKAADGTAVAGTPRTTTFTTLSTTDELDDVRTALDDGAAYTAAGIDAGERTVRFDTATDGARSVFPGSATATVITRSDQTRVDGSSPATSTVPNTAGTYAFYGFGSITSPRYLRSDATIKTVPTGSSVSPEGKDRLGVVMLAPRPTTGACIRPVVFGHGFTRSKLDVFLAADSFGAANLAVFATDVPGHGFGRSSTYTVTTGGASRTGELLGRGRDLTGDGTIESTEGVTAGGANTAVNSSDGLKQAVIDNMALVRALEKGVDVDGDGSIDTCTGEGVVGYYGQSFGGIYGTMLLGTDPRVRSGVPNVAGGPVTEISRLGGFRPLVTGALATNSPSLLNGPPGLFGFTESMPLRRDPAVSDPQQGAIPIQELLARNSWVQRSGSPEAYAPRLADGARFGDKKVLFQIAYGDGTVPNPTSGELLRAGGLYDRAWVYRNDRTSNADKNPHGFLLDPFLVAHTQGQTQIRQLLAAGTEIDPDGAGNVWEPATARLGSTPDADYRVQLDCLHYPDPQTGQGQTRTSPAQDCRDQSNQVAPLRPAGKDRYVALPGPQRVLDSRIGLGTSKGIKTGRVTVDLSKVVPDAGASTAVLNVTVLNARSRGFVVAFPGGAAQPPTSNVNVERSIPGQRANTQANEVFARLSQQRQVDLVLETTAEVVVDVVGFLTPNPVPGAGRLSPLTPQRLLDTRQTSQPQRTGPVEIDLTGTPAATATSVLLNVTATRTSGRGFVVAYPGGTGKPGTSNVNFERGQTQANEVLVRVGDGGKVVLDSSTAASLVVDLVGRVEAPAATGGSDYRALTAPRRLLDTRIGLGAAAGRVNDRLDLSLPSDRPAGTTGAVLNVTAVGADKPGFVTVYAAGVPLPETSNVNFTPTAVQANEVLTQSGTDDAVSLYVGGAGTPRTHLVVDIVGYLTGPTG